MPKKKHMSPVLAAVEGAVVGGLAVAGAMTLANEKKMGEIKKSIKDKKDDVVDYAEGKKEAAMKTAENVKATIGKAAKDIKNEIM